MAFIFWGIFFFVLTNEHKLSHCLDEVELGKKTNYKNAQITVTTSRCGGRFENLKGQAVIIGL